MKENTVKMFGIWLLDSPEPVAMFEFEEHATGWARDNYFGQWLMKPISIPYTPLFTPEEWEEAEKEAQQLIKKFHSLPEATN